MTQTIEGITPAMLWTFCVVLVGLLALVVLVYKVVEIFRKEQERRKNQQQLAGLGIEERIASAVMLKLNPELEKNFKDVNNRIDELEDKLTADKRTIEAHTSQLSAYENRVDQLEDGNKALCHGVFALLGHQVNGNSIDKLIKTHDAMKNYLIDGKYNEEAWQ